MRGRDPKGVPCGRELWESLVLAVEGVSSGKWEFVQLSAGAGAWRSVEGWEVRGLRKIGVLAELREQAVRQDPELQYRSRSKGGTAISSKLASKASPK